MKLWYINAVENPKIGTKRLKPNTPDSLIRPIGDWYAYVYGNRTSAIDHVKA